MVNVRNQSVTIYLGNSNPKRSKKVSSINDNNALIKDTLSVLSRESLSTSLQTYLPSSLESICIILSSSDLSNVFDPLALAHLVPILHPLIGTLSIQINNVIDESKSDGNNMMNESANHLQLINTAFLLAGLVPQSEKKDVSNHTRVITAKPASMNVNSSSSIQIKTKKKPKRKPIKIQINKAFLNDDDADDDLFVNEDDLLIDDYDSDGFLAPPPEIDMERRKAESADDCGGRKACDNCSCGRAEMEQLQRQHNNPASIPTSSCGNCSKGDAFRCAGCPYLGKPAFKSGEEHLVLDLTDDI